MASRKKSGKAKSKPKKPENVAIGARIRACRKALFMTADELAAAADLTVGHVYALERGVVRPRDRKLVKLARALEVTPRFLVTGKNGGES
jgi:transcriptional regulator with XRE-family HTH domain